MIEYAEMTTQYAGYYTQLAAKKDVTGLADLKKKQAVLAKNIEKVQKLIDAKKEGFRKLNDAKQKADLLEKQKREKEELE